MTTITTRRWNPLDFIRTRRNAVALLDAMLEEEDRDSFPKSVNTTATHISEMWGNRDWAGNDGQIRIRTRRDAVAQLDTAIRTGDRNKVDAVLAEVVRIWGQPSPPT